MTSRKEPRLLDVVAVLNPPADERVEVGDVGTVVELLPPDAAEVEFLDRRGRTRCLATLKRADLLVLNRERTRAGFKRTVAWARIWARLRRARLRAPADFRHWQDGVTWCD